MGTGASIDSPTPTGVAFPKQDGDDDVLTDLQPGLLEVDNNCVSPFKTRNPKSLEY